ncbi:MAG: PilT/PilU family type 4a pilus ATPase [Candidatus Sumerlaeaceae bacterium]|nr:PilT/PilU family type 4a pilus ATPase [Candidatus Sumerlaeaceae bacterium]
MNFEALMLGAKKVKASDIHLIEGSAPFLRIHGDLKKVDMGVLGHDEMQQTLRKIMPHHLLRELESQRGCDFSYQHSDEVRFRCVAYYAMGKLGITMRLIPLTVPTIEELELPEVIRTIARNPRGLVLLTGMTGSGKTTTLATMIDYINAMEALRIITIEDPIEYMYTCRKSIISQRELGKDIPDFNIALRQAMRMDPDVILVGEMRDAETIKVAIKAAETGHLVLSTLHTTSAVHTVQRMIGYFDESEHDLLREQLSLNLRASITQRLVKRADGSGRIAAMEIMVVNATIAKLIKDNRITDIFSIIKGREDGMQTFDQALADLVRAQKITFEEGSLYCEDFYAYKRFIAGIASSGDRGAIIA